MLRNNSGKVDLHLHTDASDGMFSAQSLIEQSIAAGLDAIAVTDHDTVDNVSEAVSLGIERDIEVIPGIEVTVDDDISGYRDIHVLGYMIDVKCSELLDFTAKATASRVVQKQAIIDRLNELGYDISMEEVRALAKGELGRPHIAVVLMRKYPDEFPDMDTVFVKLLGKGKKAFVQRAHSASLKDVIAVIKKAKGIPVLAHPALYVDIDIDELIIKFKELGGLGIETYYPYNRYNPFNGMPDDALRNMQAKMKKIAEKHSMLQTGGSDSHGTGKVMIGEIEVPYELVERLKELKKQMG